MEQSSTPPASPTMPSISELWEHKAEQLSARLITEEIASREDEAENVDLELPILQPLQSISELETIRSRIAENSPQDSEPTTPICTEPENNRATDTEARATIQFDRQAPADSIPLGYDPPSTYSCRPWPPQLSQPQLSPLQLSPQPQLSPLQLSPHQLSPHQLSSHQLSPPATYPPSFYPILPLPPRMRTGYSPYPLFPVIPSKSINAVSPIFYHGKEPNLTSPARQPGSTLQHSPAFSSITSNHLPPLRVMDDDFSISLRNRYYQPLRSPDFYQPLRSDFSPDLQNLSIHDSGRLSRCPSLSPSFEAKQ